MHIVEAVSNEVAEMEGAVSMRNLVLGLVSGLLLAFTPVHAVRVQAQDFALAGQVSSAEEGAMEGVLVSAKKAATVTVFMAD